MFSHRSVGVSTHQSRTRGVLSVQNENVAHHSSSKSTTSKTPATSSKNSLLPRRAFGDISNKKSNSNSNNAGKENIVLKPRATTFTPRSTNNNASLIPKLTSHSSKTNIPSSKKSSKSSNQRKVDFPVPRTHLKPSTTKIAVKAEPVDDVELPAGRLWVDQLENDDDDDLSTSSLDQAFTRTMWDDWRSSVHQKFIEQEEELARHEDREVQAHIEKVMKEQDEGKWSLVEEKSNRYLINTCKLTKRSIVSLQNKDWSVCLTLSMI